MRPGEFRQVADRANAAIEDAVTEVLRAVEGRKPPDVDFFIFLAAVVRGVLDRVESRHFNPLGVRFPSAATRMLPEEGQTPDPAPTAADVTCAEVARFLIGRTLAAEANPRTGAIFSLGAVMAEEGEPRAQAIPKDLPSAGVSGAVARALERGKLARAALEADEGGSKSSEQVADLLDVTRQAIDQKRRARQLVAWQNASGHWRFPVWQFDPQTARPYPGLAPILAALPGDPWTDMIFFLSRDEGLGQRPLDLLRSGRAKRVVAAALRYGHQGA